MSQLIIDGLLAKRKELEDQREKLRLPLEQVEKDLENISGTIALYQRGAPPDEGGGLDFPVARLRGLTQIMAIIAIAKHNGGIVRAQEAKKLLIRAGLMRQTKNSGNVVHATILRSDKFERIAPGEYRLKEMKPIVGDGGMLHAPVYRQ